MKSQNEVSTTGTFTIDVVGRPLCREPLGRSLEKAIRALDLDPDLLLLRANGCVISDPALFFPKHDDLITVDYRVRGA